MPRTYECPCCRGHGLVSDHSRHDPEEIVECAECEASGQVSWSRRRELLAWHDKCRARPLVPTGEKRRA
jgi:DnaJ-class molecular chaperone